MLHQFAELIEQIAFFEMKLGLMFEHTLDLFSQALQGGLGGLNGFGFHGFADAQPMFKPRIGLSHRQDCDAAIGIARPPGGKIRCGLAFFAAVSNKQELAQNCHDPEPAAFARSEQEPETHALSAFSLNDRRSLWRKTAQITLEDDRLEAWRAERLVQRILLDDVRRVRLTVEPAGQSTQIVCRVSDTRGEIAFSSKRLTQTNQYDDQVEGFKPMLVALHERLADREDGVEFLEGPSFGLLLMLSLIGGAMAVGALGFMTYMFLVRESAMLGFTGLPFFVIGAALAWVFKPRVPEKYDRASLIERFKD